jgi:hypothetical protein
VRSPVRQKTTGSFAIVMLVVDIWSQLLAS